METSLPDNVAEASVQTVRDVTQRGAEVSAEGSRHGSSTEILGYTTGMTNPRARIGAGNRPLNTVAAVARFVWLVSGSDRLEDIAYYENKVRGFTDDGLSVPGSSYGKRIFNSSPGTNQMRGVLDELRERPDSRRAATVVWLPEDAVRQSNDIPCTFGLFFHVRDGGLIMTTVMRSNNAVTLLPYNFFEFSMIGEIVATELGVRFDRYVHWAASMHFFEQPASEREKILATTDPEAIEMPAMPNGVAMELAYELARREAALRHASTLEEVEKVAADARAALGEYWAGLFDVLHAYGLAKRGFVDEATAALEALPEHFRSGATKAIAPLLKTETVELVPTDEDGGLFGLESIETLNSAVRVSLAASRAGDADWLLDMLRELPTSEVPITLEDVFAVREKLQQRDVTLAARGAGKPLELTADDVADALGEVREERGS